jgi:hypothetical protein
MSTDQSLYKRKWQLVVGKEGKLLDLSEFRIVFTCTAPDVDVPAEGFFRIYNLALPKPGITAPGATIDVDQYTTVSLQAGYENGPYGSVFNGTIKQFRRGREDGDNVETFVDIFAADGDELYNFGFVNTSIPKGTPQSAILNAIIASASQTTPTALAPSAQLGPGGTNPMPRGKVIFGLMREGLRNMARSQGWTWSIVNGEVQVHPQTGYLDGQVVELNALTGMIGLPEQTTEGIIVRCLLNPLIRVGTRIKINNSSIQRAALPITKQNFFVDSSVIAQNLFLPTIANDGVYRVLVNEITGDTRGNPWYCTLTCLAVDQTVPQDQSVPAGD